ncbi:hypothetical protein SDC9_100377 [bioreactor metagenome]|uniref:Uncharacterized protein n=1 Tax=bioreactor metagenome TaxID=1076179 RepID=A0A645AKC9_9ZZZZ
MHPEELEALEHLQTRSGIVLQRENQANHHLVAPLTERRDKDKEDRQSNQHRQTAAKHADALFAHDLLLFGIELLRVFFVLFANLVQLRLNRLHLHGRLAGPDVAKHRQRADEERCDDDGQNDAFTRQGFEEPAHSKECPLSQEEIALQGVPSSRVFT